GLRSPATPGGSPERAQGRDQAPQSARLDLRDPIHCCSFVGCQARQTLAERLDFVNLIVERCGATKVLVASLKNFVFEAGDVARLQLKLFLSRLQLRASGLELLA